MITLTQEQYDLLIADAKRFRDIAECERVVAGSMTPDFEIRRENK